MVRTYFFMLVILMYAFHLTLEIFTTYDNGITRGVPLTLGFVLLLFGGTAIEQYLKEVR